MPVACPGLGTRAQRIVILFLVALATGVFGCDPELGAAVYPSHSLQSRCAPGTRPGPAGITDNEATREGIKYNVRTPSNYAPGLAHPLLMVYAPAKRSRMSSERFTDLTLDATAAGFVVAYADNRPLSPTAIVELATIPGLVAKTWCIDESRIFLTGHSDGGSVSMGMAFIADTKHIPMAIAPSAAGITKQDLLEYECPDPISVMVLHSANDRLFPDYGVGAAQWWAQCNGCDLNRKKSMDNGCNAYIGCTDDVQTWYCEGDLSHSKWPGMNSTILEFFARAGS